MIMIFWLHCDIFIHHKYSNKISPGFHFNNTKNQETELNQSPWNPLEVEENSSHSLYTTLVIYIYIHIYVHYISHRGWRNSSTNWTRTETASSLLPSWSRACGSARLARLAPREWMAPMKTLGKPWENHRIMVLSSDLMGFTLWLCQNNGYLFLVEFFHWNWWFSIVMLNSQRV